MKKTILIEEKSVKDYNSLDATNPLKDLSKRFHHPLKDGTDPLIYLSGNSLGLQPDNAEKYVLEELQAWKKLGVEAHLQSTRPWLPYHEFLTSYSAEIVGALDTEVVVMNSLTVNLHLLMASFYRPSGKRKKILIENQAFSSDRYVVQSQLRFHGNNPNEDLLVLESDQNGITSMSDIMRMLDAHGSEIALILIGGVNYYTGQAFDMAAITDKAQNCGCRVGFDLAHAAGNLKMQLHDWGVDFAAWCGYKYLNGGPGAPSGAFVHEKHHNKNLQRLEGWWGHNKEKRFDPPDFFEPINSAEAWQVSNPPILSMAALRASLELFDSAGMDALSDKSKQLTSYLEYLILSLNNKDISIITPVNSNERGAQLSFQINSDTSDSELFLKSKNIVCDFRKPNVIRAAPCAFYNSYSDVYHFAETLNEL